MYVRKDGRSRPLGYLEEGAMYLEPELEALGEDERVLGVNRSLLEHGFAGKLLGLGASVIPDARPADEGGSRVIELDAMEVAGIGLVLGALGAAVAHMLVSRGKRK